jgi:hypothetical protein
MHVDARRRLPSNQETDALSPELRGHDGKRRQGIRGPLLGLLHHEVSIAVRVSIVPDPLVPSTRVAPADPTVGVAIWVAIYPPVDPELDRRATG